MTPILQIDTSPRGDQSHSRTLAQDIILELQSLTEIRARDPVPYIDDAWVTAKFTAAEQRTPELAAAIARMRSTVRPKRTFAVDDERFQRVGEWEENAGDRGSWE